jgi:hypothetical protein
MIELFDVVGGGEKTASHDFNSEKIFATLVWIFPLLLLKIASFLIHQTTQRVTKKRVPCFFPIFLYQVKVSVP